MNFDEFLRLRLLSTYLAARIFLWKYSNKCAHVVIEVREGAAFDETLRKFLKNLDPDLRCELRAETIRLMRKDLRETDYRSLAWLQDLELCQAILPDDFD